MPKKEPLTIATTITITDAMLDGLIRHALVREVWNDETDSYDERPVDIDAMIKVQLAKLIDDRVGKVAAETTERVVAERVDKILDEGFPVFARWGERDGTKTLAQVVGEAIFAKNDYSDGLKKRAHDAMRGAVDREVKAHIHAISGDVAASMKAAASEALGNWMKRTVGLSS